MPEIFQQIMQDLLHDIPQVRVFFDDVIIFSANKADHKRHIQQVLDRLRDNSLTINAKKSIFGVESIDFMGHRILKNEIEPNERSG